MAKRLSDLAWPLFCDLGFSGGIGFCAGIALKVRGARCLASAVYGEDKQLEATVFEG